MLTENIKINVDGMEIDVLKGTTLLEVSKMFNRKGRPAILAKVNGHYKELYEVTSPNSDITFCDLTDTMANRSYLNGLIFLVKYAFTGVFKNKVRVKVKHSADKALCFETTKDITKDELEKVKKKMLITVSANLPITRITVLKSEAIDYFKKTGEVKKKKLLEYINKSYVHLYKMGSMYDINYSKLPSETSVLNEFDLTYIDENEFALNYPTVFYNKDIAKYQHHEKLYEVFRTEREWAKLMNVETCADLNEIVSKGKIGDLIRISETLQNNKLLEIARMIASNKKKKIVLMAGPSSSGKTTSCNKLAMYLKSLGLTPKVISMDNFFKNRADTPKKPNGDYDFECLEALDLKLFSKTMQGLLGGLEVKMPEFDFVSGEKKFRKEMKLEKTDILLIEGIHALNPKLLSEIEPDNKFKIYLSPLTGVNIDETNRMQTTDNRLLRRMIRDNRTRGYNISDTLSLWDDVREGEEKYIFPFQDNADVVFNTSLIYEFCILKTYVLPLIYSVPYDDPYYDEANRLMKVLDLFLPIPSESVPDDSILREFIGGSYFE